MLLFHPFCCCIQLTVTIPRAIKIFFTLRLDMPLLQTAHVHICSPPNPCLKYCCVSPGVLLPCGGRGISAEGKQVSTPRVYRYSSGLSPPPTNGNPPFYQQKRGFRRLDLWKTFLIVCNSARITIHKTICRKVQMAAGNDI